jgi:photosystem I P700 chlorophyll a apoprotein A1
MVMVVTFKVFKQHQVGSKCGAEGLQVKLNYIGLQLRMSAIMLFAGWFHYHKQLPKLEWFQNAESMMNHHLAGLLGLGCLSWSGHQITLHTN